MEQLPELYRHMQGSRLHRIRPLARGDEWETPRVAEAFKRRRRNSQLRPVAARCLVRYAGLSQRGVADLLNVGSGSAVCNQLNRLSGKLATDRKLRGEVSRLEKELKTAVQERRETYAANSQSLL